MADLIMSDWEKVLLAFCEPEGIEEFFNIRNAIREMMRQREALLALKEEVDNVLMMAHSFANFPSWLEKLDETQIALPKHLKGVTNERSRKA